MQVEFTDAAGEVADRLEAHESRAYQRLWDVLDRILEDVEEARARASYVSSRKVWADKVPGTDYTVFWRVNDDDLLVVYILADIGI